MRYFLVCILILSMIACRSYEKPEKPANLIPKEKMASILYDVYILNAAKGSNKMVLENNGIYPENYVFEKHGIDSLQFAESNAYYGFFVEEYEEIITDVGERIKINTKMYREVELEEDKRRKRKRDSLKKIKDSIELKNKPKEKSPRQRILQEEQLKSSK